MRNFIVGLFAFGFAALGAPAHGWIVFSDATEQAGIDFLHVNGANGEHLFPEPIGSGAAFFDYDRDGWLDLYLVNGGDFRGAPAPNVLYRNNGDGTFSDATAQAGVADAGYGVGVCVGDFDADGWEDLYVCNFRRNALFRNNGDGTFSDVTDSAGVGESRWSAAAAFFDADNDGDLDLIVANYVRYVESRDGCEVRGISVTCGPENFDGETDTLYRNNGDGTFTDISASAGIASVGRGLAVVCGDYDDDGDLDIFLANDMSPNFLYQNQGDGTFLEIGFDAGIALAEDATMGNGMGVDLADYDNDGGLDLIVTNFQDQVNTLYRNDRDGFFTDVSYPSGTGVPSLPLLAWGCGIVDLDNDGWRDLFVANGHVHDNIRLIDDLGRYAQPKLVYRNRGDGMFENLSDQSGEAASRPEVSRGAAFGDYDNDGDLDVVVNNLHGRASLLRNDGGNANGWVRVLVEPPHRAVGARVWFQPEGADKPRLEEIRSGGSFASHSDTRPLFGLGGASKGRVWVEWKDGARVPSMEAFAGETVRIVHPSAR